MPFLNTRKEQKKLKEGSLVAVFDIASASVGGLLFRHHKKTAPEILTSLRLPVIFKKEDPFPKIWQIFHKSFSDLADRLKKSESEKPEIALCVFSSPWYVSQTRIVKVQRKAPFQITEELITKIIEDEMEMFKKEWHDSSLGEKGEAVFLENKPIKSVLNGYVVENPLRKKVVKLELSIYLSLGLKLMEQKIKQDILSFLAPHAIRFNSFPFAAFKILKHIANTQEGLLLVDITGEITDVFLVRDDVIEEIGCFSKGMNFLARRVASVFDLNFSEAKSLLSQYERNELDVAQKQKISDTIKPAIREWTVSLKSLLKKMASKKLLPQNFYFCGHSGPFAEINGAVGADSEFSKLTVLGKPLAVSYLSPESLKYHFNFKHGFSGSKDVFLLLEALFISKIND